MSTSARRGAAVLELDREQILAHRRRVVGLRSRTARSADALRAAARPGLTDSMPRAAVCSLHARVDGITPDVLDVPELCQVWGPRFSVYVVASEDVAVFTLGRLPTGGPRLARAIDIATRLGDFLDGREAVPMSDAGRALGIHHNAVRYAAPTGTVRIAWDGARQPTIWTEPAPDVDPADARAELARRYVHVAGPTTSAQFARWAGVTARHADEVFASLHDEVLPVRTPIGDLSILASDETSFRDRSAVDDAPARLLPSGDVYWLLWDDQRNLLVPDHAARAELWTSRVWPGALMVAGEIVGTWRRSHAIATVTTWRTLTASERDDVEREAAALPIPDLDQPVQVRWST